MMEIFKECCKNCLLSPDSIVSPKRRKEIINDCAINQTHFICHKSSIDGGNVVCNSFFNKLGYKSQMVRIAGRLNMLKFIDQPEHDKLPTYNEMKTNNKK